MKKIDTHGLTLKGLRKASHETAAYYCLHTEVFYNRITGEVWAKTVPWGVWTHYDDPCIVKAVDTRHHLTMQAIADEIDAAERFIRFADMCNALAAQAKTV